MRGVFGLGVAMLVATAAPGYAQQAKFLEKFSGWSAYAGQGGGKKMCFIVAQPADSAPKNVRRGPIYFYVTHYPGDKVKNEISLKMGYPLRPGVPAEITIAGKKFPLFTKAEGAYVAKRETEGQIVAAMKAGAEMVVKGRSTRGTLTTDKYTLSGLSAALDRIAKECP